jgi:alpha-L-fucosidase
MFRRCLKNLGKVCVAFALSVMTAGAQDRMQWFEHDKFGMFVHWGPYSYLAGEWRGQRIPVGTEAEWIMQRFNIPVAEYRQMAHGFNPEHFDAEAWVELAKATGMKYLVITAKHHDGFAMYQSHVSKYNIVDWTPFKRDPVREIEEACRRNGIRFGIYYSHREDWDDPNGFGNTWDYDPAKKDFDKYLEGKSKPQLRELLTGYGPVSVVWFDRGMDTAEHAREFRDIVRSLQPDTLINGRIGSYGQDLMGDYQDMNDNGIPTDGLQEYWEAPQTMNTTWGYSKFDQQWKTPGDVIRRLVEIVSKGGNYLLNIGPMADGTIPAPSVSTLEGVGKWMRANSESIYGTSVSPLAPQPWGRTTVKGSKVYLHVFSWPSDGQVPIPGLKNRVLDAYPLTNSSLKLKVSTVNGTSAIAVPAAPFDLTDSVLVAEIEGTPRVDPPIVVQGTETPFELDYMQAITGGKAVKRFNREGKFHVARWMGPGDFVEWHLLVSQSGPYHVRIRYSAPKLAQGGKYVVTIGEHKISASVNVTGEGFQYRTFDLGAAAFGKAGFYSVRIAPAAQYEHDLMFFQTLELIPNGPLMVE